MDPGKLCAWRKGFLATLTHLQPIQVTCVGIEATMEPQSKSGAPLVVLVLRPDIVDTSSIIPFTFEPPALSLSNFLRLYSAKVVGN